jgi:hypothetical protein
MRSSTKAISILKRNTYHLQRPNPSNPNLKFALHALNVVQLNTFPPTPPGWLSPEEEEFLCHAYCVVGEVVASDICSEPGKCDAADDCFLRFSGAVAPSIVMVKTTALMSVIFPYLTEMREHEYLPSSQHFDQMLFRSPWLLALS